MPSTTVDWYRVGAFTAAAIQAQIDLAVAASGGVVYLPPGTYMLEKTVEIPYTPPRTAIRPGTAYNAAR